MRFPVQILRLMLPFYTFTMKSTFKFTFFTFQNRLKSKSDILEILPSWYILSLKPKGKGDCKNLSYFSSVSCLFICFNLDDEFELYNFTTD